MEIYIFFIAVLFCLAISDLMVGVANDAINFLNSAIGSKVAKRTVILAIASLGIIGGALLSNGMMEVARKGLFHPQFFLFTEIILIFMAVMFTDVLLLDFFNTFGLPTSTTVSLVFGLLGAAVGMAVFKAGDGTMIMVDGVEKVAQVGDFINSSKALTIISSILLSVVFSFVFGVVIQWLSRLLFSFNTERTIKRYGALWGGVAIAAITYFILIKGLKDASFMSDENYKLIQENTFYIVIGSFVVWSLLLQLLSWLFKTNPLKIVVLAGTFALAMAFAGNDLVNFIGVPLAGFEAFKAYSANNGTDLLMTGLLGNIKTPMLFLVGAGVIMVITLWFSKKAKTVADTELKLSRQDEGSERFGSSAFSRYLVRRVVRTNTFFSKVIPQPVIAGITKRFDRTQLEMDLSKDKNPPMFDLVRASVNMMVASILIAIGTSFKLPLSTTYVTFMVAMSTSLVDGAWGRDSAVYRITGVFTVIGGWFMTGLAAFTVAFLLSYFLGWTELTGVIILVGFAILAFYRTNIMHKKISARQEEVADDDQDVPTANQLFEKCNKGISKRLNMISELYKNTLEALFREDYKELKKQLHASVDQEAKLDKKRNNLTLSIPTLLSTDSVEATHYYILSIDYLKELAHCTTFLIEPIYKHVDNNHKPLLPTQVLELTGLSTALEGFFNLVIDNLECNSAEKLEEITAEQIRVNNMIKEARKNLIRSVKKKEIGTKNSILVLGILSETRNLLIYTVNMMKIHNDFTNIVKETN